MTGWDWPDSQLIRVLDGDTIEVALFKEVKLDVGFGIIANLTVAVGRQRLRLRGIDAEGPKTEAGRAAARRLEELLRDEDSEAGLHVMTYKPYKYGGRLDAAEYMGEVVLRDGRFVTEVLLEEGLVRPYDGNGPSTIT